MAQGLLFSSERAPINEIAKGPLCFCFHLCSAHYTALQRTQQEGLLQLIQLQWKTQTILTTNISPNVITNQHLAL